MVRHEVVCGEWLRWWRSVMRMGAVAVRAAAPPRRRSEGRVGGWQRIWVSARSGPLPSIGATSVQHLLHTPNEPLWRQRSTIPPITACLKPKGSGHHLENVLIEPMSLHSPWTYPAEVGSHGPRLRVGGPSSRSVHSND